MRKTMWIWIALAIVVIVAGVAVWAMLNANTQPATQTNNTSSNSSSNSTPSDNTSAPANQSTEALSGKVDVTIQDMSFSPATIKVKKGTTVTWTNQDSVQHNAVGDSAQTGGLATSANLLSKGQAQSFTFNTVGTFSYHCSLHPNMHGTVEVVE